MKKLNIFFALIFLACLTFSASAQIEIGIKVGGNLSNIHQDFKDSDEEMPTKMKVGFHVGLTSDIPINEMFSFQPGLLFTTKGYNYDLDELVEEDDNPVKSTNAVEVDGYMRTSLNYIEIPLNIAFKTGDLQIFAGPYLAVGIGGKHKADFSYSIMGYEETEKYEIKLKPAFGEVDYEELGEDEDAFSALDYGLNFGVGYRLGPVLIQGAYSLGLGNITPKYKDDDDNDRSDYKMTNRVITLSVSYFFGD